MKKALVLLNMGGPNNLAEVELFLKNMFNDKHILSMPKAIRKFVAGTITTLRVEKAQEIYREIGGKSPLVDYTNTLIKALEKELDDTLILSAMRYTPPFANQAVETIKEHDIKHIYVFPMYPHHSTTTTSSSVEDFLEQLELAHVDITTTIVGNYFKNRFLNEGIIDSIRKTLEKDDEHSIDLIFSAHGLPKKVIEKGDLYQGHVEAHVALLKKSLKKAGLFFNSVSLAYQSKVGPLEWIGPSLEDSLVHLKSGKQAMIYPIAFTIDNSETEHELQVEYKEIAQQMGYEYYKVVPALNSHPLFVQAIKDIIEN